MYSTVPSGVTPLSVKSMLCIAVCVTLQHTRRASLKEGRSARRCTHAPSLCTPSALAVPPTVSLSATPVSSALDARASHTHTHTHTRGAACGVSNHCTQIVLSSVRVVSRDARPALPHVVTHKHRARRRKREAALRGLAHGRRTHAKVTDKERCRVERRRLLHTTHQLWRDQLCDVTHDAIHKRGT